MIDHPHGCPASITWLWTIDDRSDAKPARPRVINTTLKHSRERNHFPGSTILTSLVSKATDRYVPSFIELSIVYTGRKGSMEKWPIENCFLSSKIVFRNYNFPSVRIRWNKLEYFIDLIDIVIITSGIRYVKYNSNLEVPPVRSRVLSKSYFSAANKTSLKIKIKKKEREKKERNLVNQYPFIITIIYIHIYLESWK